MSEAVTVICLLWAVWVMVWLFLVVTKATYRKLTGYNDGRIERKNDPNWWMG